MGDVKNELYKNNELQNLEISIFLFGGDQIKNEKIVGDIKIDNNGVILVVVEQKQQGII